MFWVDADVDGERSGYVLTPQDAIKELFKCVLRHMDKKTAARFGPPLTKLLGPGCRKARAEQLQDLLCIQAINTAWINVLHLLLSIETP